MFTRRVPLLSVALLCGLLALVFGAADARAQATLQSDVRATYCYGQGYNGYFTTYLGLGSSVDGVLDSHDFNASHQAGVSDPNYGSGFGYATHISGFTPSAPGIGGTFSTLNVELHGRADADGHPFGYFETMGWSYVRVTFTVDHPTNWSWAGASDGGSYGAYFNGAAYGFQLYHVDQFGDGDYDGSDNFNGAWNQPISHSGVLLPGYTYHLSIDASASATAHYLWSGSGTEHGEAHVYGTFTVADPDSDSDGLNDGDEASYGTNPFNPDTDGDGLLDGTEVHDTGTDPLHADSDGDSIPDGAEVAAGTDPLNPDTDGDGVWDAADDMPLDPGVSSGQLEKMTRSLGETIQFTDLSAFNGPNANANKGRRNALANRAVSAANAIAEGDLEAAADALNSLIVKVDGIEPEPDWMESSPAKEQIASDAMLLLALLYL